MTSSNVERLPGRRGFKLSDLLQCPLMKLALVLSSVVVAVLCGIQSTEAAKADKTERAEKRMAARMLGRFDANHDGTLDTAEAQRVRKAFEALKELDADKNGELSDSEIAAAKIVKRAAKRTKEKGASQ